MTDANDYTIEELLEEAANDPSWESDAAKREMLVKQLRSALENV